MEYSIKNKYLKILIDIIFISSIPFMSLIFVGDYDVKNLLFLFLISLMVAIFIKLKVIKNSLYENINIKYLIFSTLFSLYSIGEFIKYINKSSIICFNSVVNKIIGLTFSEGKVSLLISLLALPSIIIFIYLFAKKIFPLIKKEYLKFSKLEKVFLLVIIVLGFIGTFVIYNKTNAFHFPNNNDFIYTTDSKILNDTNAYINMSSYENDLRQPLFALFSFPFFITSKFISSIISFIPNSFYVVFGTIQIFLLFLSIVLIERMLKLKENKLLFLLLFASSFGVILFSFVYEQYIISLFYLILAIYVWYFYKPNVNYSYIGAVGTLITSGVILPVVPRGGGNLKEKIKNIFKCFIGFLAISILTGKILLVLNVKESFLSLMRFSGKNILFVDKLKQFLYFVQSIFIAPKGNISFSSGYPSYRLVNIN